MISNIFSALSRFFVLLALMFATHAKAGCSEPIFTAPQEVKLAGDKVMIVTHASSVFDPRYSTKYGVDAAIKWAKEKKIPVVYLADESPISSYFMEDCSPSYWVRSIDGDVVFEVKAKDVFLVGGHVELCLSRSIHDILYQASKRQQQSMTLTYFMDGIYSNGKTINESDPFYKDFMQFMGAVTFGRPGGERWPKLNLLEATGIIKNIENDYRYLQELLPRWDRTFPKDYRVELQLNDFELRVLQPGGGFSAPRLKFHFIDSADSLS